MDDRKCIWCSKVAPSVTFNKVAHSIPQSLLGKHVCENVCDSCNLYFGSWQNKKPPIEVAVREVFIIAQTKFLGSTGDIGKNKAMARPKSEYFDIDYRNWNLKLKKSRTRFDSDFKYKLTRQFKRGFYKMYLEELERQLGEAHLDQYDFVREFARYDLNDLPLFYFDRSWGIIAATESTFKNPNLEMDKEMKMKYLVSDSKYFNEFEFLGHTFSVVTHKNWKFHFNDYQRHSLELKKEYYRGMKPIQNLFDIDLTLRVFE